MKRLLISLLVFALMVSLSFFSVSCKEEAVKEAEEAVKEAEEAVEEAEETVEEAEEAVGGIKEEIIYVSDQEPKSMDPIFTEGYATLVLALFYDPLLKLDDSGEYVGVLAESYTVSDDGLSIILNIRQGIKFHDGTDFNAEAVKWNLDRARTEEKTQYVGDLESIEEVVATDEYTVEIKLSTPDVELIDQLVQPIGYMVSPTAAGEYGEDFHLNAVGTGPYLFEEWSGGNRVVGVRNENYWRSDEEGNQLPYSNKAIIRYITEPSVAMIELQSGNVDAIRSSLIADFKAVDADPNLQIIDSGLGTFQYCILNNTKAPFDNEKVRQAFNAAIDREIIAQVISEEYGKVIPNFVSPLSWVYDSDLVNPYAYDPELAKTLLAEAGYSDGLAITLSVIKRDPDIEVAQLMQDQLLAVGINTVVEIMERQAYVDKVVVNRGYESAALRIFTSGRRGVFLIENGFGSADASMNFSRFNDQEVFDLMAQAKIEKDKDKRYELYSEAQQLVLDGGYFNFIFLRPTYILTTANLVDYKYTSVNGGEISLADTKIIVK